MNFNWKVLTIYKFHYLTIMYTTLFYTTLNLEDFMIDLHTHSTASDGTFTPAQLIEYVSSKKITTLALTDHDTVSGILEAQNKALSLGINFIAGIEISVDWPKGEFHLLGLGLKKCSAELQSVIDFVRDERINRNEEMARLLRARNIDISLAELEDKFQTQNIGRPHFAQMLTEKGYVKTRQQAFDNFFAVGRPCYVKRIGAPLSDAIEGIKTSGGIPVQAHPLSIYVAWGKMEEAMSEIQSKGVMGLEAYPPGARGAEALRLEELARKLNMIVTAGSDFHGEKVRADRKIGISAGKKNIEDRFWEEELKPLLEKVHEGTDHSFK